MRTVPYQLGHPPVLPLLACLAVHPQLPPHGEHPSRSFSELSPDGLYQGCTCFSPCSRSKRGPAHPDQPMLSTPFCGTCCKAPHSPPTRVRVIDLLISRPLWQETVLLGYCATVLRYHLLTYIAICVVTNSTTTTTTTTNGRCLPLRRPACGNPPALIVTQTTPIHFWIGYLAEPPPLPPPRSLFRIA